MIDRAPSGATREELVEQIDDQVADHVEGVPFLADIHFKMERVESIADQYAGRYGRDADLCAALMRALEVFRDWLGAY